MIRRLFTILSILSLLLCVAMAGMWVRSYWIMEDIGWERPAAVIAVAGSRGQVLFYRDIETPPGAAARPLGFQHHSGGPTIPMTQLIGSLTPNYYSFFGFAAARGEATKLIRFELVVLPHWFLVFITSLLPIRCWMLWRGRRCRERRQAENRCVHCGYDLRATPDRCPECGTAVPEGHVMKVHA